jgi:hypothetical protein
MSEKALLDEKQLASKLNMSVTSTRAEEVQQGRKAAAGHKKKRGGPTGADVDKAAGGRVRLTCAQVWDEIERWAKPSGHPKVQKIAQIIKDVRDNVITPNNALREMDLVTGDGKLLGERIVSETRHYGPDSPTIISHRSFASLDQRVLSLESRTSVVGNRMGALKIHVIQRFDDLTGAVTSWISVGSWTSWAVAATVCPSQGGDTIPPIND